LWVAGLPLKRRKRGVSRYTKFEGCKVLISPPQLLITDDDTAMRETLRSALEPRGFRTVTAGDGAEALAIVQRQPIHLLLTDMYMPKMTGLETIRRVKQVRVTLPCILLSASLDDALAEKAKQVAAFSVLSKPVRFADVTRAIYKALHDVYGWSRAADEPPA